MKINKLLCVASISLTTSLNISANEDGIQIYGFASYVGGMTLEEEDLPNGKKSDFSAADGNRVLQSDQFSYRSESTYGLQIDADLEDGLSAKALLQADGSSEYDVKAKWTYFDYEIKDDLILSGGRQPLPLFYYTDFVDVGYSYLWVRAPLESYYIKNSTFDGVQLTYAPSLGEWESKIKIYHGQSLDTDALELNDMNGLVVYVANSWLELRATMMETNIVSNELGFEAGTGEVIAIGEEETASTYMGAAFKVNLDSVFFSAEWARDEEEEGIQEFNYLEGVEGWYASTGMNFGDLTPYITYAESTATASEENILTNNKAYMKSKSWTVGSRWDFHSNAALKIEYTDRKDLSDEVVVLFFGKSREVSVISAGVDLVF